MTAVVQPSSRPSAKPRCFACSEAKFLTGYVQFNALLEESYYKPLSAHTAFESPSSSCG